jgi:hypothetical protein
VVGKKRKARGFSVSYYLFVHPFLKMAGHNKSSASLHPWHRRHLAQRHLQPVTLPNSSLSHSHSQHHHLGHHMVQFGLVMQPFSITR